MKKEPPNIWDAETLPADPCHHLDLRCLASLSSTKISILSFRIQLPPKAPADFESMAQPVMPPDAPPDRSQEPGHQRGSGFDYSVYSDLALCRSAC